MALTDERVRVGLIADGLHVDPAVVAAGGRAPSATGCRSSPTRWRPSEPAPAPGPVGSLGVEVAADDGSVRLPDGTLAGSTLALDRAVRNLVAFAGARPRRPPSGP